MNIVLLEEGKCEIYLMKDTLDTTSCINNKVYTLCKAEEELSTNQA